MLERYAPSGQFSPATLLYGLVFALVIAGGAWLYQALVDWIPLIYVSFLATLGFAAVAFVATGAAMTRGNCRNAAVAVLLGLAIGAAGTAGSHWFAYQRFVGKVADNLKGAKTQAQVREAIPFGRYLGLRAESGWRVGKGKGAPLRGFFVWAIWGIEALVIVGGAAWGAKGAAANPFCENCLAWAEEEPVLTRRDQDDLALERLAQAARPDELFRLAPAEKPAEFRLDYLLHRCRQCDQSSWLTVKRVRSVTDGQGKTSDETKALWELVLLSPQDVAALRRTAEELAEGTSSSGRPSPEAAPPG